MPTKHAQRLQNTELASYVLYMNNGGADRIGAEQERLLQGNANDLSSFQSRKMDEHHDNNKQPHEQQNNTQPHEDIPNTLLHFFQHFTQAHPQLSPTTLTSLNQLTDGVL